MDIILFGVEGVEKRWLYGMYYMQLRFETSHLHAHTKTQEILRQQLISINGKSMNLLSVQSANTPQKKKKKKKISQCSNVELQS